MEETLSQMMKAGYMPPNPPNNLSFHYGDMQCSWHLTQSQNLIYISGWINGERNQEWSTGGQDLGRRACVDGGSDPCHKGEIETGHG